MRINVVSRSLHPVVLTDMSTPNSCTQFKYLSTPLYSREVLVVRREGVDALGVGCASKDFLAQVGPPLNLILYMHPRIFAYSSNILIANLEPMDSMLASGTWKNLRFLRRSCSLGASSRYEGNLFNLPSLTL
jgi:hypothetical protein